MKSFKTFGRYNTPSLKQKKRAYALIFLIIAIIIITATIKSPPINITPNPPIPKHMNKSTPITNIAASNANNVIISITSIIEDVIIAKRERQSYLSLISFTMNIIPATISEYINNLTHNSPNRLNNILFTTSIANIIPMIFHILSITFTSYYRRSKICEKRKGLHSPFHSFKCC